MGSRQGSLAAYRWGSPQGSRKEVQGVSPGLFVGSLQGSLAVYRRGSLQGSRMEFQCILTFLHI